MQLYASRNIHFLYILTFWDSLLERLHEFPTSKQIMSLNIGQKCIISYYNESHIIQELCIQVEGQKANAKCITKSRKMRAHFEGRWCPLDVPHHHIDFGEKIAFHATL